MLKTIIAAIQIYTRAGNETYEVLFQHPDFIVIKIDSNKVSLIFYGTDTILEWADNFRYGMVSEESFPKGWYLAAVSTFEVIKTLDLELSYVLGYSRGAAIALIYSYLYNIQAVAFSAPNVSKELLYWDITPILIGSLNDPVNFVPFGYRKPGNYIVISISSGGHFWEKEKYTTEVKKYLHDKPC